MNIVTALQCEADPVIDAFDLSGMAPSAPFQIYNGDGMRLIVSEPGLTAAAAAVSYLAGITDGTEREEVWLNAGVAGHPERPAGEAVFAGKIVDTGTDETWYPQPVAPVGPDLETVHTVREPVRSFDEPVVHDMEAAGFYEAALRFTTVERAHCLKIVSDGADRSFQDLDRQDVRDLVSKHMDVIHAFRREYEELTDRDGFREEVRSIKETVAGRAHFTQAQLHQLEKWIERWRAVYPARDISDVLGSGEESAGEILSRLSSEVESAPVTFESTS